MEPMTEAEQTLTIKNVISACRDIRKLNKRGYNFLYLASGFIAHYDIHGFMFYYGEPGKLRLDILRYQSANTWSNFIPGQEHYEYYMAKAKVYSAIVDAIKNNDAGQMVFA